MNNILTQKIPFEYSPTSKNQHQEIIEQPSNFDSLEKSKSTAIVDMKFPSIKAKNLSVNEDIINLEIEESKKIIERDHKKDDIKRAEFKVKGLLKTYLVNKSEHKIHHYWDIFGLDSTIKSRIFSILLNEAIKLSQNSTISNTQLISGLIEYCMFLLENLVISVPEIILQAVTILTEYTVFTENSYIEETAEIIQEILKIVTAKYDCLSAMLSKMNIINGKEDSNVMKIKIQCIVNILKSFKMIKKDITKDIEFAQKKYLSNTKISPDLIKYFNNEIL